MQITCLTDYRDFEALGPEWNAFPETSGNESFTMRHEWLASFFKAYGKEARLFVLVMRENGKLSGAVPLMLRTRRVRGIPVRSISFIGNRGWTPGGFLSKKGGEEDLIGQSFNFLQKEPVWDLLELWNMPEEDKGLFKDLMRTGPRYRFFSGANFPYVPVRGGWEDFKAQRSAKFRKVLRNKLNRINKAGKVEIHCHSEPGDIARTLNVIFGIGLKSWKHRSGLSISSTEANREFYTDIAERFSRLGFLRIWVLSLNGKPAAFEYQVVFKNRIHALTADYDEALGELSPGSVLEYAALENAFKTGALEYEMGSGSSFYKLNWTGHIKKTISLSIYRETLRGLSLNAIEKAVPILKGAREALLGSRQ